MESKKSSIPALLFAIIVPAAFLAVLVFPESRTVFQSATGNHPYIMGFIKFAFLATTGEILAGKVTGGVFAFPKGTLPKACVWGVIGMMIALLFPVFSAGVTSAQDAGLLFGKGNFFFTALLTSLVNNLTFGISMMAFHRVTDTMIELHGNRQKVTVMGAVKAVDWPGFVSFVILRTLPFFWIPAHTVTFMLPPQYRVFLSAFLSIILGLLLAIAKRKSAQMTEESV